LILAQATLAFIMAVTRARDGYVEVKGGLAIRITAINDVPNASMEMKTQLTLNSFVYAEIDFVRRSSKSHISKAT